MTPNAVKDVKQLKYVLRKTESHETQNRISKLKTELQNPKTESQNPKQSHETQNRIANVNIEKKSKTDLHGLPM